MRISNKDRQALLRDDGSQPFKLECLFGNIKWKAGLLDADLAIEVEVHKRKSKLYRVICDKATGKPVAPPPKTSIRLMAVKEGEFVAVSKVEMRWQPVETAQAATGLNLLLQMDCGPGTLPSISIGCYTPGGWTDSRDSVLFERMGYRVTHWMCLPEPAKVQG